MNKKLDLEFNSNNIDMESLDDKQIQILVIRSTLELARRKKKNIFRLAKELASSTTVHKYLRNKEKYIIKR